MLINERQLELSLEAIDTLIFWVRLGVFALLLVCGLLMFEIGWQALSERKERKKK